MVPARPRIEWPLWLKGLLKLQGTCLPDRGIASQTHSSRPFLSLWCYTERDWRRWPRLGIRCQQPSWFGKSYMSSGLLCRSFVFLSGFRSGSRLIALLSWRSRLGGRWSLFGRQLWIRLRSYPSLYSGMGCGQRRLGLRIVPEVRYYRVIRRSSGLYMTLEISWNHSDFCY